MADLLVSQDVALPRRVDAPAVAPLSRLAVTLVLLALAVGSFGIGTGEFAIMGFLPSVAGELGITTPEAGHAISAYALGVVIGAPVIAVLGARRSRRFMLLAMMLLFAVGNALSALAPSFGALVAFRFLTGLPHGAYFGIAALVAASIVPPQQRAQAVGLVLLGLTVATLVGTPVTTVASQVSSWRMAFAFVSAVGLLTMVLVWRYVPQDVVDAAASPLRELGAFARKQVWLTLGIAAVGFGGMFSTFSYIASTATQVAHMPEWSVPLIMAVFGVGMVGGNLVGSRLADKALMPTIGGIMVWNIVVLTLYWLTASNPFMLCLCIFLVGCGGAVGPALQVRLMDVAADAQTLAAATNHSAFNMANALGAWLGGMAIAAGYGFAATGWVGAILSVLGLFVFLVSLALERRDR